MGNITTGLVFVMIINVLMFFSQVAVMSINPEGPVFYHCEGSVLENFGNSCSNTSVLSTDNLGDKLPSADASVNPTTGNIFTDTFSSIKGWFIGLPGVNYLYGMVSSPFTILSSLGLPNEFVWGIGVLWYGLTLFFIVAFLVGRND